MRRLLKLRFFGTGVVLAVAIAACQRPTNSPEVTSEPSSNSDGCQIIAHVSGETEICGQPQRVIALGPYVLEPLIALGIQPTGFADHMAFKQSTYDNPSAQIPYLGERISNQPANVGVAYTPSIEAISKAQPDLIIGSEFNAQQYETLSKIAPTVLLDYYDTEENLRTIAKAVSRSDMAEQLIADTEQTIASAQKTFSDSARANPNALLLFSNPPELAVSKGNQELCHTLLEKLGFQLVSLPGFESNDSRDTAIPISSEQLSNLNNADFVILLGSNFETRESTISYEDDQLSGSRKAWQENAIAQSLDASKAGRVYFIPAYMCLGLPGPIGTELYLDELKTQLLSP
ncbi:MAG: iron-siderophore ABC transporter substrate-binding protein [Cyanobacteria bacterium P01_H01_bin.21]